MQIKTVVLATLLGASLLFNGVVLWLLPEVLERPAPQPSGQPAADPALKRQLASLGYLSGAGEEAEASGVTVHKAEKAQPGLNLYLSGHAAQATLIDMAGQELHRWAYPLEKLDSKIDHGSGAAARRKGWRKVHLFENGDLLATYQYKGLIKIDRHSRLIWHWDAPTHHEVRVLDDGTIATFVGRLVQAEVEGRTRAANEDALALLGPGGKPRRIIPLKPLLERSDYRSVLERAPRPVSEGLWDPLHCNAVEPVSEALARRLPQVQVGDLLVSMRNIDLVAAVRLDPPSVVWAVTGLWHRQHSPSIVGEGRLLVFDNQHRPDRSRVIEVDPLTGQIVWRFPPSPETPFFTEILGSTYRLQNGNTLIVESNRGRALEVTPGHDVVWEFVNPHRVPSTPTTEAELVNALFDLTRLPPEAFTP